MGTTCSIELLKLVTMVLSEMFHCQIEVLQNKNNQITSGAVIEKKQQD